MNFPIRIIWEGKASSTYDQTTIERRLEVLRTTDTDEARREVEFLENLKQGQTHASDFSDT